jgi:hypothetical protein
VSSELHIGIGECRLSMAGDILVPYLKTADVFQSLPDCSRRQWIQTRRIGVGSGGILIL